MSIFAKIRQVYDRLCGCIEASADRMRQESVNTSPSRPMKPTRGSAS